VDSKIELPADWKWMKLGEVIKLTQSGIWGDDPFEAPKEEVFIVIRSTEIDHKGVISIKDEKVAQRRVKPETARKYFLKPNDLLIVRSGGTTGKIILGRVGIYLGEPDKYLFSNFLLKMQADENLALPEFLWRYLNWNKFLEENIPNLMRRTTGIQNLPMDEYFSILIPLPPPPEQKQIVAKLQEMMKEINQARTACKKQLEAAKSLPSAYLREVFESPESQKWEKKKLGEVCEIINGFAFKSENFVKKGTPLIRISELQNNFVDISNSVKVPLSFLDDYCAFAVKKGDILIAMSGATTGKIGFYNLDSTSLLNQRVGKFAPDENLLLRSYLNYFVLTISQKILKSSYGSAQPNISTNEIKEFIIPIPPLPEQKRIAAHLKEKIDQAEKLRASIEKELETINALPQSILSKAFKGEL
jgi:type I restriction enzyme S subunit